MTARNTEAPTRSSGPFHIDEVGATGVLIRPDRYLLATARSAAELVAAAELIPWAGSQREAVAS